MPAWRVFLPLTKPVGRPVAVRLLKGWARRIAEQHFKPGRREQGGTGRPAPVFDYCPPEQGMYAPCPRPGYQYVIAPGRTLDPDAALAELALWEQAEASAEEGPEAALAQEALEGWVRLEDLGEPWLVDTPDPMPRLLHTPDGKACYLARGKVGMLVGAGGRGKSQALADLAVAVASGGKWLRTYPVEAPGRVLLAYGEEDLDEARRRLHRTARSAGLLPDPRGAERTWATPEAAERFALLRRNLELLPLYGKPATLVDPNNPDLASPFTKALLAKLGEPGEPWALVILDPGARFMGPMAETDNAAATRFVEVLEQLTQVRGGPTVLLAHHTSKAYLTEEDSNQGAARGSSALVDGARWVANLDYQPLGANRDERDEARAKLVERLGPEKGKRINFLRLHVTKTNYGPRVAALELVNFAGPLVPAERNELEALAAARAAAKGKAKGGSKGRGSSRRAKPSAKGQGGDLDSYR